MEFGLTDLSTQNGMLADDSDQAAHGWRFRDAPRKRLGGARNLLGHLVAVDDREGADDGPEIQHHDGRVAQLPGDFGQDGICMRGQ